MATPSTLRLLQDALQAMEREIAGLQQEADQLRQMILRRTETDADGHPAPRMRATRARPTKAARNALVTILRDAGRPLHYNELTELLAAQGVVVGGRDPRASVRSHLSHDERFVPLGRGRWGLASWPASVKQGKLGGDNPVLQPALTGTDQAVPHDVATLVSLRRDREGAPSVHGEAVG